MGANPERARAWLTQEDTVCYEQRVARLEWLESVFPPAEYWAFPGGLVSKFLFEEMRYSFVYGQFLAATMAGLAYIEWTLAAKHFMAGRDDLERAAISVLLREAQDSGLLTAGEVEDLDRLRRARNPVAHFRRPLAGDSVEMRALKDEEHPYEVLEKDARAVVLAAMNLVRKGMF